MDAIKTIHLTKSYGKARGIVDLNLTVKKGDFFGFIGPNGAGKSTTIRTLLGLIYKNSGSAEVLGLDIEKNNREILSRIGYLPSESAFYPGMRVKDVLKLSADLRNQDCQKEAQRLCERLQLDTSGKIEELSFGNKKKVSIICALQHNPELLILDEPTGGLDPLMQREFFEILKERNNVGTTIFLSSHILSEIQRNCNRAAIIREGKIIACDSVESLARAQAKRITIHGDVDVTQLEGVKDLHSLDEHITFLYSGEISILLKALGNGKIEDLTIAEPDLEEIFMHYYETGGEA